MVLIKYSVSLCSQFVAIYSFWYFSAFVPLLYSSKVNSPIYDNRWKRSEQTGCRAISAKTVGTVFLFWALCSALNKKFIGRSVSSKIYTLLATQSIRDLKCFPYESQKRELPNTVFYFKLPITVSSLGHKTSAQPLVFLPACQRKHWRWIYCVNHSGTPWVIFHCFSSTEAHPETLCPCVSC